MRSTYFAALISAWYGRDRMELVGDEKDPPLLAEGGLQIASEVPEQERVRSLKLDRDAAAPSVNARTT